VRLVICKYTLAVAESILLATQVPGADQGTPPAVSQVQARVAGVRAASILNRVQLASFQSSTKIEALREELARMLARDPSAKAIVFSQVRLALINKLKK
jgi:hypothetical protein